MPENEIQGKRAIPTGGSLIHTSGAVMLQLFIKITASMHLNTVQKYLGCMVVFWLVCWTASREVWGSNPGQGRNLVRGFCFTCAPSQLSYDEYTDRTRAVGR